MNTKSNEKETFVFKTNINCGGCVAKITPFLDNKTGIETWSVDTANKDKTLKVTLIGISESDIIKTVQEAGFKIETLK